MKGCLAIFFILFVLALIANGIESFTGIPKDSVMDFLVVAIIIGIVAYIIFLSATSRGGKILRSENLKKLREERIKRESYEHYRNLEKKNEQLRGLMKRDMRRMKRLATDKEYDYDYKSYVYYLPGKEDPVPLDAMIRDLSRLPHDEWNELYSQYLEDYDDDEDGSTTNDTEKSSSITIQIPRKLLPYIQTNFDSEEEREGYVDGINDGVNDYNEEGALSCFKADGSPKYRAGYSAGYAVTSHLADPDPEPESDTYSDEE